MHELWRRQNTLQSVSTASAVQGSAVHCEEFREVQRGGEMGNTLMDAIGIRVHLGTLQCKAHSTSIRNYNYTVLFYVEYSVMDIGVKIQSSVHERVHIDTMYY